MKTLTKTITAAAAALAIAGGAASTASAGEPYTGALCSVNTTDYMHTDSNVSSPTVFLVGAGEQFRVQAVGNQGGYWVYGHSTYSYPTSGWFLRKYINC